MKDYTDHQCKKCTEGAYIETSIHDDMDGVLHCSKCAHQIQRYAIEGFFKEYRFLSNFYPGEVRYNGVVYPTVEHAYQAAKTLDLNEQIRIKELPKPGDAKREGKKLKIRQDWEEVKLNLMEEFVYKKFKNQELRQKLLATGNAYLEETNNWHDNYYGVCTCGACENGQNNLGKLLMKIRKEIKK